MYRDMQAGLASLQQDTQTLFDAVAQSITDNAKLVKSAANLSARMDEMIKKFVDNAAPNSDPAVEILVLKLDSQIQQIRVANLRGQLVQNTDMIPLLDETTTKAMATAAALQAKVPEDARAQIAPLTSAIAEFHTTAQGLVGRIHLVHDLFADKVTPQITQLQQALAGAREELQVNFETTKNYVESSIVSTVLNQKIIGALTLLFGGLMAFFVARAISNPITALTKAMRGLAEGNFSVLLPGLKRKDEVGNIAKAVEAFKVKAAEKAQREAEARKPSRTSRLRPSAKRRWPGCPTNSRRRSAASSRPRSPATSPSAWRSTARPDWFSMSGPRSIRCATMSPRR